MVHFMTCLFSMSLQAVLIICVVFVIRRLFSIMRISKKYTMLLWMATFFFLVFPWKVVVSGGFWNGAAAGFVIGGSPGNTLDGEMTANKLDGRSAAGPQPGNAADAEASQIKTSQTDASQTGAFQTGASRAGTSPSGTARAGTSKMSMLWNFWKSINAGSLDIHTLLNILPSSWRQNGKQIFCLLCAVWAGGMLCFLIHGALSYRRLKRNVLCSIQWETWENQDSQRKPENQNYQVNRNYQVDRDSLANPDGPRNPDGQKNLDSLDLWKYNLKGNGNGSQNSAVYCTDGTRVPVTLGYFRPRIYLPADMDRAYAEYVIAHEDTHIARKDPITKAAAYFITCLHWPNPAVWLAYSFMAKDMEMACDEETVARLGMDRKKAYAAALLQLSTGNGAIFAVPPAFGEGNVKERIKNIVHYQKTVKKAAAMAVATGLFITSLFLTASQGDPAAQATAKAAGTENPMEQINETDGQSPSAQTGPSEASLTVSEQTGTSDGRVAPSAQAKPERDKLTFAILRKAFAEKAVSRMDFHKYVNGRRDAFNDEPDEETPNYDIFFTLRHKNEDYNLQLSFKKSTGLLEDIYITRLSNSESAWLYTKKDGQEEYPRDLEVYLNTKTAIEDWLTLELPKGYTLGSYQGGLIYDGGALISPQVYESENPYTPVYWTHAGFAGRLDPSIFVFENGKLDETHFPTCNHTFEEAAGVFDPLINGMDWQVLVTHAYHELYTLRSLGDLEQAGADIRSLETVSEYWYFYFVKEGAEHAYVLSLSAKEFTREEAVAIAKTVRLTEDSAAKKREKDVQHALDAYFSDFLTTLPADSDKDFGKDDFASINGYMAAKWFATEREIYKAFQNGVHTVHLTGIELYGLTEQEGSLQADVSVNYQYACNSSGPKEGPSNASCPFRVYLKPAGAAYQVTDIDCYDSKEIIMLKEAIQQAGTDLPGSYQLVDEYFGKMQQDAKKLASASP